MQNKIMVLFFIILVLINKTVVACDNSFLNSIDANFPGKTPTTKDENYEAHLVGVTDVGPKGEITDAYFHNPQFVILDRQTCKVLKIINLNPFNDIPNGDSGEYELLFGKAANSIVISQHWRIYGSKKQNVEKATYNTVTLYDYKTFNKKLDKEVEPGLFWRRSRKYILDDGQYVLNIHNLGTDGLIMQKIDLSDLTLESEYRIDGDYVAKLGLVDKIGFDIFDLSKEDIVSKGHQWFFDGRKIVKMKRIYGIDANGNLRGVYYTFDNKPVIGVWHNPELNFNTIEEFEKEFNIKVEPLVEIKKKGSSWGKVVSQAEVTEQSQPTSQPHPKGFEQPQTKPPEPIRIKETESNKGTSKLIYIVIGLLLILVLGVIFLWVKNKSNKNN